MASALQEKPWHCRGFSAFRFSPFLLIPWCAPTEIVRGRAGGLRRGVSRMDAAIELTWTYLQRPLRN
ncbi:MAG: hypothetical protein WBG87_17890, partial [Stenotrophomonas maltophilia]